MFGQGLSFFLDTATYHHTKGNVESLPLLSTLRILSVQALLKWFLNSPSLLTQDHSYRFPFFFSLAAALLSMYTLGVFLCNLSVYANSCTKILNIFFHGSILSANISWLKKSEFFPAKIEEPTNSSLGFRTEKTPRSNISATIGCFFFFFFFIDLQKPAQ